MEHIEKQLLESMENHLVDLGNFEEEIQNQLEKMVNDLSIIKRRFKSLSNGRKVHDGPEKAQVILDLINLMYQHNKDTDKFTQQWNKELLTIKDVGLCLEHSLRYLSLKICK